MQFSGLFGLFRHNLFYLRVVFPQGFPSATVHYRRGAGNYVIFSCFFYSGSHYVQGEGFLLRPQHVCRTMSIPLRVAVYSLCRGPSAIGRARASATLVYGYSLYYLLQGGFQFYHRSHFPNN